MLHREKPGLLLLLLRFTASVSCFARLLLPPFPHFCPSDSCAISCPCFDRRSLLLLVLFSMHQLKAIALQNPVL